MVGALLQPSCDTGYTYCHRPGTLQKHRQVVPSVISHDSMMNKHLTWRLRPSCLCIIYIYIYTHVLYKEIHPAWIKCIHII